MTPKINIKIIVTVAILIAMEVVLSRFCSISLPFAKIGFGFVPIAVCAILYGPVYAGVAGVLADVIGANLFPIGPYFFGYTISAALYGIIFGMFLYNRRGTTLQVGLAAGVNCLCVNLFLTTYWIAITYGVANDVTYLALFKTSAVKCSTLFVVQFAILKIMQQPVRKIIKGARAD